ncbi:MAG: CDP-alcohol phosphatidyltransferase family protein [Erysipelotrichaceae bacterium]|nr:CDP-alcohol phosphatidyltransferase family protein [Erysipelotrichaceae bacterium]
MKRNEVFTIPNILSMIRILLLPVVIYYYMYKQDMKTGVIMMFFCEITDFFDGFLARKLNQVTKLGGILDPISDKISQLVMCICVYSRFPLVRCLMYLFIGKEFISFIFGLFLINTDFDARAKWFGKVNTVVFDIVLGLHMLWFDIPYNVSCILVCISAVLMVVSAIAYYSYWLRYLFSRPKKEIQP